MPTKRLLIAALLLILVSSIAALDERVAPFVIAADIALMMLFVADLTLARRRGLGIERVKPATLVQGVNADFSVVVRGEPGGMLELRDGLHPGVAEAPLRASVPVDRNETRWTLSLIHI